MKIIIKWQDKSMTAPNWFDFPVTDIDCLTVGHAVNLFSRFVPVIIKEGDQYLVNTSELYETYKKKKQPVMMITEIDQARFEDKLSQAGFVS